MKGVKIVSDSPISRSAALEDVPNAETLAAMKEAESGHDAGVVKGRAYSAPRETGSCRGQLRWKKSIVTIIIS